MHERYAKDGLACVSVSVDEPEHKDRALRFLREQKAAFANYFLDEPTEFWQEKWDLNGPPAIFVFDRRGRRAAKFQVDPDKPYTDEDVEALVKRLLKQDRQSGDDG